MENFKIWIKHGEKPTDIIHIPTNNTEFVSDVIQTAREKLKWEDTSVANISLFKPGCDEPESPKLPVDDLVAEKNLQTVEFLLRRAAGSATVSAVPATVSVAPPEARPSKRSRIEIKGRNSHFSKLYHRIAKESPDDPKAYSDPENIWSLPFPFQGHTLPMDRFSIDKNHTFDYMGREAFTEVLETIEGLDFDNGYRLVYVYGTIGYGKSHILAAMTCYLLHQKKRVVYLPDCRSMAKDYIEYFKAGLLVAFGDSELHQAEISDCTTEDHMKTFCNTVAHEGTHLYFIVDQVNALDNQAGYKDGVSNEVKDRIHIFLDSISCNHYCIQSASANVNSALYMGQKQTSTIKLSLIAGFTKREMEKWWNHHQNRLPKMTVEERKEIEDITGGIPLLLRALWRFHGQDFKDVGPEYLFHDELKNVINQIDAFVHKKRSELSTFDWGRFIGIMNGCLLENGVVEAPELYDHRYFYIDGDSKGHYTCGLARESMARTIRDEGEDIFLRPGWINNLTDVKSNASVLGFHVEHICLSSIAQKGLNAGALGLNSMKTLVFRDPYPIYDTSHELALYIPWRFNFKAIDGLIVQLDNMNRTCHLIPIQITIAKNHSRSEDKFFCNWDRWTLKFEDAGYEIRTTFLWIIEKTREVMEVSEQVRSTRNGDKLLNPDFTRVKITVEDVNKEAGIALEKARCL